jgi:GH24 family phage-related lysozyme (muramidase)
MNTKFKINLLLTQPSLIMRGFFYYLKGETLMSNFKATKLSEEGYKTEILKLLRKREAGKFDVNQTYPDPLGIPTIGAGYALAVRGKDGKYKMRPLDNINDDLKYATDKDNSITAAEHAKMQEAMDALNKSHEFIQKINIRIKENSKNAAKGKDKELNNAVNGVFKMIANDIKKRDQKKAKDIINENIPKVTLNKENGDIDRLTMLEADRARDKVVSEIKGAAQKRKWSKERTDKFIKEVKNSKEMVTLTSVKYNMGNKMPNTVDALLNGDRARMYYEVKYNSNGGDNESVKKGIANRRAAEAELLDENGASSEWNNAQNIYAKNKKQIDAYEKKYPNAFGKGKKTFKQLTDENNLHRGEDIAAHLSENTNPFRNGEDKEERGSLDDKAANKENKNDFGLNFDDPIYKQNNQVTEFELSDLQRRAYNSPSSSSKGIELEDKVSQIYDLHYLGAVQKDATGRMQQPKASVEFPTEISVAKTKDGFNLKKSFFDVADKVESSDDKISMTKTLQKALNHNAPHVGVRPLKEDGIFGEKTASALTKSMSTIGANVYKKLFV